MSPDGRSLAVRHKDRLAIALLAPAKQTSGHSLPIAADDFAFVDQTIWVVSDGKLGRYDRSGRALGDPVALAAGPGRLVVPREPAHMVALWRTPSTCTLLTLQGEVVRQRSLEEQVEPEDFVALLSERRLLVCRGNHVRLHDIGRGDVQVGRLPIEGRVVASGSTFSGRNLVLLVQQGDRSQSIHILSRGALLRSFSVEPVRQLEIAVTRGIGVAHTLAGEIVVTDLSTENIVRRVRPEFPISDLAITPDGARILLASLAEGADPAVFDLSTAELPRPVSPASDAHRAPDPPAPQELHGMADPATTAESGEAPPPPPPAGIAEATPMTPAEPAAAAATATATANAGEPAPRAAELPLSRRAAGERQVLHEAVQRTLEAAICHVALLYERLYFLSRNLGLLPRTTSAEDPLGPIVISDVDVTTIFAGLNRLKTIPIAERATAAPDPFKDQLAQSRAALRAALESKDAARSGLTRLVKSFQLDEVETDLLLLALSPDWDLRVTRLAGFLNNDATSVRPKVGHLVMAAQLGLPSVGSNALESIERALFATGLVVREPAGDVPVMGQVVRCPDYIVQISSSLLEATEPGDALTWDALRWEPEDKEPLRSALHRELRRTSSSRLIALEGPPGSGRMAMATAVAIEEGVDVERCDLLPFIRREAELLEIQLSASAYRARIRGGVLVVRSDGTLRKHERLWGHLWSLVTRLAIPCFVLIRMGELEGIQGSVRFVRYLPPQLQPAGRKVLWAESLHKRNIQIHDSVLDDISVRYDITPGRLLEVVDELQVRQSWDRQPIVGVTDMRRTLRDITVQRLTNLATRYDSKITLQDLIYPDAVAARIRELVHRIRYRHRVLSTWNFADKAHQSYGVSALFYGPPGTGKTAGAAAIANALEVDLYMVDFPSIMSKWIGETEQNLAKVFDEAEASSVALLFDEADAIFGKRSAKQESSSDRYANLTVNYLIQRMEWFNGLAILTTNLETAMDEAFERRITARIRFPESDEKQRMELWKHLLPPGATYADDVDLAFLSRKFRMEGAYIRRALTRAAFRAASSGRDEPRLSNDDLLWAALAEYEDMGRVTYATSEETPPTE